MNNREENVIYFPDKEEMAKRLQATFDEDHLRTHLFPLLLANAGRRVSLQGFVMVMSQVINQLTENTSREVYVAVQGMVPEIIDVLVDDMATAEQIKEMYAQVYS